MKNFIFCAAILFLTGCGTQPISEHSPAEIMFTLQERGMYLEYPSIAQYRFNRPDGSIAFATTKGRDGPNDFHISIYDSDKSPVTNSSCDPSLMGASVLTPLLLNDGTANWGRVDFFDHGIEEGDTNPTPLCMPPFPPTLQERFLAAPPCIQDQKGEFKTDCISQLRKYEIKQGLYSAYAMCSEKDGKTVVICISQMKDDPEMAKQIFETFRWTK
jgi:hypothetical protein